jgi:hypothetical protein
MRRFLAVMVASLFLLPAVGFAQEPMDEVKQKLETLQQEMKALQDKLDRMEKEKAEAAKAAAEKAVEEPAKEVTAAIAPWLELGGDYRARLDYLSGDVPSFMRLDPFDATNPAFPFKSESKRTVKNDTLLTNRFGINLKAKATEDVQVKARLVMYKVWGHETDDPVTSSGDAPFFADRVNVFDGTIGHVPADADLIVDYAYATWSNIAGLPAWFSVGRRPSTGGIPGNIRQNQEKIGTAGIPNILVDYAFDGISIGAAPYIEALPGAYAKFCYGRGFEAGFESDSVPDLDDVDFIGLNVVPYDTDNLHVEVQYDAGFNIFDTMSDGFSFQLPPTGPGVTVTNPVSANLGNIHWVGGTVMGKVKDNLNLFVSPALSWTDPNDSTTFALVDFTGDGIPDPLAAGLLNDCNPAAGVCEDDSHTGWAVYLGGRYDFPSGTKIGVEYNHGSKYWISTIPAADDMWTSKLGTRGDVYEAYIIQELKWLKPISKAGKAYFRLGYQYYDFDYTGSNNWVGAPKKIEDLCGDFTNPACFANAQFFTPLESAHDVYLTFEVRF